MANTSEYQPKEARVAQKVGAFLRRNEVAEGTAAAAALLGFAWAHRQQIIAGLEKLRPEVGGKAREIVEQLEQMEQRLRDNRHAPLPPQSS